MFCSPLLGETITNLTNIYFSDGLKLNHQLGNLLVGPCMRNIPEDSFSLRQRCCHLNLPEGNDAVEVGIVPVSEVEENWTMILGVVNWGGKGPPHS